MTPSVEVVIPVYNEGPLIERVLRAFAADVRSEIRVLLAYDHEDDNTLPVALSLALPFAVVPVRNDGRGVHDAVTTAFRRAEAPYVVVWPADDDYNTARLDGMVELARTGCEIVCASRFMPGGGMRGAPRLKDLIVRTSAVALHRVARLPTRDPSNGLRLFSLRVLRSIPLESTNGFTYSIELLVKCHRLRWPICEMPFEWYERRLGKSRFQIIRWLPAYYVWFKYAFATTLLRRGPESVPVNAHHDAR